MKKITSDITKASTLEGKFYTSEYLFKDSLEKVFSRNWQFITDTCKLKEDRNAFPFNFLAGVIPEPLVLINNKGNIKCFSNVVLIEEIYWLISRVYLKSILLVVIMESS